MSDQDYSARRQFLTWCAGAGLVLTMPRALAAPTQVVDRSLSFYNLHTGESLRATYFAEGAYQPSELAAIARVLRDHRSGDTHEIDRALLDTLAHLQRQLRTPQAFHVISGYRSPATNAQLHERSNGVARHSMHIEGKAIDIRVPGRDLKQVHRAARLLRAGGVGYYPNSDFVHLDVGRVRYW